MKLEDDVDSSSSVLGPEDGDILGDPDAVLDRFMIEEDVAGGRFALIEHRLAPQALAAPLHLHKREDEYSYILEGEIGAYLGGSELVAHTGDLIAKPRGPMAHLLECGLIDRQSPGDHFAVRAREVVSFFGYDARFV